MTGAMAAKIICLPNRKNYDEIDAITIKNIMKSKIMKKHNNLPVQHFKNEQ